MIGEEGFMIESIIIFAAVGIFFTVLGYLVWIKEKITLIHDYHVDKVSEKNKKAYCRLAGIGLVIFGTTMVITAVLLAVTESRASYLCFACGCVAEIVMMIVAGVKYNKKEEE